ncbi:peroxidase 2-like [Triticum aestivum]|uniref:peroxidase 2-like n=1 Tax=Triticum aestivum TaxID=4565 RepID=UPI001D01983F|nr:peroxidase 2-like [Triticum aestivum]
MFTIILRGPSWTLQLGRRDSTMASVTLANNDLPPPSLDVAGLSSRFATKGFSLTDMVVLSGAHTVGRVQCKNFRNRLYNEANIDPDYATKLKANCPQPTGSGDRNLAQLDDTTATMNADSFDNNYFLNLQLNKGLLHSDQVLSTICAGGATENIVDSFAANPETFRNAFASAMVKMGNLSPLTGSQGMVRRTRSSGCRFLELGLVDTSYSYPLI